MDELIITKRNNIVAIANAVRKKLNITDEMTLSKIAESINNINIGGTTIDLDAEVTEQETIAASQDALVGNIMAALECKAVGGGKTTKTINIDWSGDEERLGSVTYISNNQLEVTSDAWCIEAEGGIICLYSNGTPNYTSNFITLYKNGNVDILVATQDEETVYPISSGSGDAV